MMGLANFFDSVVHGDDETVGAERSGEFAGPVRINDLLREANEKFCHIGRVDIEKRRFQHRLQVVQKLEDSQRSNVVRSVQESVRNLDVDDLNAIYAFVKNAQLQRMQGPKSLLFCGDERDKDPSTPYYDLYKVDFPSFNRLHTALSLWGEGGNTDTAPSAEVGSSYQVPVSLVLAERAFRLMDRNRDGLLNFREVVQLVDVLAKGD